MIKLEIDPITRRILAYVAILSNSQIFKDDIILEDSMVPSMDLNKYYINGEIVSSEKTEYEKNVEELELKLSEFNTFDGDKYFFNLVKGGTSLKESRTLLSQKLEEKQQLEDRYNLLISQHKEDIFNFYIQEYKKKEATMEFKYYSSVILLIKDENKYLSEWINWYYGLGLDHIFIYDNGSVEDENDLI